MPQITCPNCGTTINLENRRALDFKLIRSATDKTPRTFTELLHITKLSRKTLNLRLKELCAEGILLKNDGMYSSNGASEFQVSMDNCGTRAGLKFIRFVSLAVRFLE